MWRIAAVTVRSVVDVAVGHFNRYHAMREELERARLTLLERKSVDRAKGLLMEQRGMGEEAAYKLLRKLAMDQNKRIGEVLETKSGLDLEDSKHAAAWQVHRKMLARAFDEGAGDTHAVRLAVPLTE